MNKREFQFSEGSSNKFWSIELRETSFIVHYGRIGTLGQSQEKTFATGDAAKKEHDKLIAEKTKKGYVEVQVGNVAKSRPAPVQTRAAEEKKGKGAAMAEAVEVDQVMAAPEAGSSPAAKLSLERKVRLSREDFAAVSWLWRPIPAPSPHPFNYEDCVRRARTHWSARGRVSIYEPALPARISAEEAWFWMRARGASVEKCTDGWNDGWRPKRFESADHWERELRAATEDPAPPTNPDENPLIRSTILLSWRWPEWLRALIPLFTATQLAERLIDAELSRASQTRRNADYLIAADFASLSLIYADAAEREHFRNVMAARYGRESDPTSQAAELALTFLSTVRGGDELEKAVAEVPSLAASHAVQPVWCNLFTLAGLPDEVTFVSEVNRLGMELPVPSGNAIERTLALFRLWLAATEWRHLDKLVKAIIAASAKDDAVRFARVLALVDAPEAAPAMLELQMHSKAPAVAGKWLSEHPLPAAVGLTPLAMSTGKTAENAREILHQIARVRDGECLAAAMGYLPDGDREWLQREIADRRQVMPDDLSREEMPGALAEALAAVKPIAPPSWLHAGSLPAVKALGKKLPLGDVERVLSALKDAPLVAPARKDPQGQRGAPTEPAGSLPPPPLVALLKQHADATSLDAFAWKLFEQWLSMGAASKNKWALGAVGHLGGDASVLKLTPLIRDWPGESQHQRAVFGLEVLRAVGTDTALMSLNGIAQKLKFQGLKEKAKVMMEGIAQARGLTREQLADRIVPDCGLDEMGGRIFDFGPRQFKFVLGAEMKPLVRDAAGKVKPDLPSPNSSDDKEKAEAAVASWKLLKKTLKEVLKIQAERLEDAMITGRRWTPQEFEMLLVKHPLMVNLARQLVFGCYDGQGAVQSTFRITEDQSLADSNDDPCDLPGAGSIGVVHPAHLDEAAKSAWGQVLSDYEIIPPFQQLGREICRPEPGDLDLTSITRFKGPKIPGIVVYGILERCHWVKDTPADGGGFMQHSKFFPAANVTAFIQYTGMSIGYYDAPQEIEAVYFVPGHVKPDWWGKHDNKLPIKTVDPVVVSEVLRLVHAIVAKGE